jgi:hypothetical protein
MTSRKIVSHGAAPVGPAVSSSSSFHTALRVLLVPQHPAMSLIYAFFRAVGDIADRPRSRAERVAALRVPRVRLRWIVLHAAAGGPGWFSTIAVHCA